MASQIFRRVLRSHSPLTTTSNFLSNPNNLRAFSSSTATPISATLFPGDGIGPEIADSVKQIFKTAEVPIEWEEHYVGKEIDPRTQSFLTWESLESVRRNKVGLKGPMATPIGKGHRSLNLILRKELNLYANVRPCFSLPGYKTRYDDVNLITIRENTEGEYSGLEHQVVRGVVESLKIITRQASLRVAEYAFQYAKTHGRERVSAIHKANIMQKTDGLFLKCCREVAEKYPEIKYEEVVIDNCCMMLVKNPTLFDVLVMPNLYSNTSVMGQKRKPAAAQADRQSHPPKKPRQENKREEKAKLIFAPRPEWHTAELPAIPIDETAPAELPHRAFDDLYKYANELLAAENAAYNGGQLAGSSSHKFLSTIMANGTLEDKISALTLLVQESPLHTTKAFENLLALSRKRSRNQALMAVAALKDMLGQGVVLPGDRKLRSFGKQPALPSVLQGQGARWHVGQPLPGGLQKIHLVVWAYEDWLKKTYFELLQVLESWCGDEVEFARSRALTYVFELLKDKPEQEENLLRLLVNKLGDTDRKIASRASYLLLQLETSHPAMKLIITNSIEADSLFRPGQSQHAKYYAIITLNQTVLSQKEQEVANRLLDIYFSLFVQLLKPAERQAARLKGHGKIDRPQQGGGGKPGKAAAKKLKAQEKAEESDQQLNDKLMAQVLTGVNRAFPFADTSDPTFEKQIDTLFRVTHSANFNTAVQALMLLQQISAAKNYGAERFYRTLYESILDPRLIGSSKQVLYLNLLYKSLKADLNAKRVQAFIKRLLQTITMHEVSFVCGVLYLVSELENTFPSIKTMITNPEYNEDDEEEHFVDVPEDGEERPAALQDNLPKINTVQYDARKRDPEHAHAERSCLWDLLPFIQHFHPSVSLFAEALLFQKKMPPKPDPTHYSLMHFLDRFVYRTARSKASAGTHGSSIMQPMGGSSAADLLVKPGESLRAGIPVNSEAFWNKKVENVAADEVFFHSYFNQAGAKKSRKQEKAAAKKAKGGDDSDEDEDRGEDEIWKAIVNSRPEVEGDDDDDDDLSMGDLEDAYSDSDDGSEGGLDLGGDGDEDDDEEGGMMLDGGSDNDMDVPDFGEDDDDAFGSDDEVPFGVLSDVEEEEEEKAPADSKKARNKKQREDRKKLKALPTFATAEDYAKLLGDDDDEDI